MNKIDLEKNVLDLSYRRNLQLINIILILGVGTFFAYIGALILNPGKYFIYTFLIIIIGVLTYIFYQRVDDLLKEISNKIKNLSTLS